MKQPDRCHHHGDDKRQDRDTDDGQELRRDTVYAPLQQRQSFIEPFRQADATRYACRKPVGDDPSDKNCREGLDACA
ncbi:hypothetical protein D3C87_1867690 [compost metagenome]